MINFGYSLMATVLILVGGCAVLQTYPFERNNEEMTRKMFNFICFESQTPIFYINAAERMNENRMMKYWLADIHKSVETKKPLNFQRISAVKNGILCNDSGFLTPTCDETVAKLASHVKAIDLAYNSTKSAALILEDDVMAILPRMWDLTIDELVEKLMEDYADTWHVIRLSLSPKPEDRAFAVNMWKQKNRPKIHKVPEKFVGYGGTSAYLISRVGMRLILNKFKTEDGKFNCSSLGMCRTVESMLFEPTPQQFLKVPQMFSKNFIASSRSISDVLSTLQGRNDYQDYVTGIQQVVEEHSARMPSPSNPDDLLPFFQGSWVVNFSD